LRIDPDRLAVIGECLGRIVARGPQQAAVVIGLVVVWIKPDRLGIVGIGAVEIVLPPIGDAAVVVNDGEVVTGRFCGELAVAGRDPLGHRDLVVGA
jgi:hypothetical protein